MVIIYNKSDYLTKVSDIEAEQWTEKKSCPKGMHYFQQDFSSPSDPEHIIRI
jgi:hypothetical protein